MNEWILNKEGDWNNHISRIKQTKGQSEQQETNRQQVEEVWVDPERDGAMI